MLHASSRSFIPSRLPLLFTTYCITDKKNWNSARCSTFHTEATPTVYYILNILACALLLINGTPCLDQIIRTFYRVSRQWPGLRHSCLILYAFDPEQKKLQLVLTIALYDVVSFQAACLNWSLNSLAISEAVLILPSQRCFVALFLQDPRDW